MGIICQTLLNQGLRLNEVKWGFSAVPSMAFRPSANVTSLWYGELLMESSDDDQPLQQRLCVTVLGF